jgi:hypothetical protein
MFRSQNTNEYGDEAIISNEWTARNPDSYGGKIPENDVLYKYLVGGVG